MPSRYRSSTMISIDHQGLVGTDRVNLTAATLGSRRFGAALEFKMACFPEFADGIRPSRSRSHDAAPAPP
jgi:hypothetical protein